MENNVSDGILIIVGLLIVISYIIYRTYKSEEKDVDVINRKLAKERLKRMRKNGSKK